MFKNVLKFFALLFLYNICFVNADSPLINNNSNNSVSLEYTKEEKEDNHDGSFNLRIGELKNGNEGLNNIINT
ncbi:hypothetical protein PIROE2DRAFT_18924 [Piromyces sp. E2]|nr:hypothetical protein PIROE2DRAFT_18924 [Piromyces sp. E2]|eukprot:OUM56470.1 hypothetical protein PIROE2DRAFT_18924 [Piromyces sp. E2]